MHHRVLALAALFVLFVQGVATAENLTVEDILRRPGSDEELVAKLATMAERFPGMFAQVQDYHIDLFSLYKQYEKAIAELDRDPKFREAWQKRLAERPYLRATFSPKQAKPLVMEKVSPRALELLKADLAKAVTDAKAAGSPEAWLKAATAKGEKKKDPISALVSHLPGPKKGEFGKAADKRAFVADYFSDEANWPTKNREEFLKFWNEFREPPKEEAKKSTPADALLVALLVSKAKGAGDWDEVAKKIGEMTMADYGQMKDFQDFVKPALAGIDESVKRRIESEHAVQFNTVYSKETSSVRIDPLKVRIEEVSPDVAIARGLIKSNCASRYTFATPLDARERVFIVFDEAGTPIGYMQSVEVMKKQKSGPPIPTLYVTSLDGAALKAGHVVSVMEGLKANRAQFGVQQISVPGRAEGQGLINNSEPIAAFKFYASLGESAEKDIVFHDAEMRKAVTGLDLPYNQHAYDTIKNLTSSVKAIPNEAVVEVKAEIETLTPEEVKLVGKSPLTVQDYVSLILALNVDENSRKARDRVVAVAVRAGIRADAIADLLKVINKEIPGLSGLRGVRATLTVKEMERLVDNAIGRLSSDAPDRVRLRALTNPHLYEVWRATADPFSKENAPVFFETFFPIVRRMIYAGLGQPELREAVKQNVKYLMEHARYGNVLRGYFTNDFSDDFREQLDQARLYQELNHDGWLGTQKVGKDFETRLKALVVSIPQHFEDYQEFGEFLSNLMRAPGAYKSMAAEFDRAFASAASRADTSTIKSMLYGYSAHGLGGAKLKELLKLIPQTANRDNVEFFLVEMASLYMTEFKGAELEQVFKELFAIAEAHDGLSTIERMMDKGFPGQKVPPGVQKLKAESMIRMAIAEKRPEIAFLALITAPYDAEKFGPSAAKVVKDFELWLKAGGALDKFDLVRIAKNTANALRYAPELADILIAQLEKSGARTGQMVSVGRVLTEHPELTAKNVKFTAEVARRLAAQGEWHLLTALHQSLDPVSAMRLKDELGWLIQAKAKNDPRAFDAAAERFENYAQNPNGPCTVGYRLMVGLRSLKRLIPRFGAVALPVGATLGAVNP